jgi:membrane protein involved in colicin uptake
MTDSRQNKTPIQWYAELHPFLRAVGLLFLGTVTATMVWDQLNDDVRLNAAGLKTMTGKVMILEESVRNLEQGQRLLQQQQQHEAKRSEERHEATTKALDRILRRLDEQDRTDRQN